MITVPAVVDAVVMDFICQMNTRHGNAAAVGHDFDRQIAFVGLSRNDFRVEMSYRKEQLLLLLLLRWLLRGRRQRRCRRWMLNSGRSHQTSDRFSRLIRSCMCDNKLWIIVCDFITRVEIIKQRRRTVVQQMSVVGARAGVLLDRGLGRRHSQSLKKKSIGTQININEFEML